MVVLNLKRLHGEYTEAMDTGQIMINKRTCYFHIILLIMAFNVAVPNNILERIDLNTSPPQGQFGCLLWTGARWSNGQYGVMRNPLRHQHGAGNQPARIGVHRLVFMLHNRALYPDYQLPPATPQGDDLHVSHLCHTPLCINPQHLVLEPRSTNSERQTCNLQGICMGIHAPLCLLW